jgi:hypothetical protein
MKPTAKPTLVLPAASKVMNEDSPNSSPNRSQNPLAEMEMNQMSGTDGGDGEKQIANPKTPNSNGTKSAVAGNGVKGHVYRDSGVEIDDIVISTA